ncbi:MAG: glycosyl hydrolase [Endomicrobiaceae bacterium]|nr:glycosyl hydrolase [Endomicrobiaceae bacterium]
MRKYIIITILCLAQFSFALPVPGGKASIKDTPPSGYTPPTAIYKTSGILNPLPTNKWFNSVLYNQYNVFSLRMFTYPQTVKCDAENKYGLLIGYPKVSSSADTITYGYDSTAYSYPNVMKVIAYKDENFSTALNPASAKLDNYSDWSATSKWEDSSDNTKWMKATFGQGFVFTYFEFESSLYPAIEFPYSWNSIYGRYYLYKQDGTIIQDSASSYQGDKIILEARFPDGNSIFYGVFVPPDTTFNQVVGDNWNKISIKIPSSDKYMSVALLPSKNITEAVSDLAIYYQYAYNFVTDTKISWDVSSKFQSTTNFNFTINRKRTSSEFNSSDTLFTLMPHQYKNLSSQVSYVDNKTFDTLRGKLKLVAGNKFATKTNFYGALPFFQYDIPTNVKTQLQAYLATDKDVDMSSIPVDTYHGAKVIARLANLLPIADNLNDQTSKTQIIIKLRNELANWFTYSVTESDKYFSYDSTWGGLIGIAASYGSQNYADHHFHYGYFIYASAILAMYDETFSKDYGGMVELLIKDIANTNRSDSNFPYMRSFDFYESHSWANGMGGADDRGIDQESSSEAMNAWSAIYLWGIATNNDDYKKLGIYLYSNENEAIKEYYFDIDTDKNILKSPYNHNSIGILWGGLINYTLHFTPQNPQTIKGIQILPLTPSMTYLAYDKDYLSDFYNESVSETGSLPEQWYDIWARLLSLFNPSQGLSQFDAYKSSSAEEGSSKTFTYHFLNFFAQYGTPLLKYSADLPTYLVTENLGKKIFSVYNYTDSNKTVRFYNDSGAYVGSVNVGAKSFTVTSDLVQNIDEKKILIYPVPYKPGSGGKYDGEGITFLDISEGANIKIFNIAGELVYEKSVPSNSSFYLWDTKNNSGNKVASGIYIYYITSKDGQKLKGKIAIER